LANGGSIVISGSQTVYAVAGTSTLSDSSVGSAAYTINLPPVITAVDAPVASGASNNSAFTAITATTNPLLTEQTIFVGAGNSASSLPSNVVYLDQETGTGACSPSISYISAPYSSSGLDGIVSTYRTSFIVLPSAEGSTSEATSNCVWSQAQANASALSWAANTAFLPGEYINVSGTFWQLQAGCYSRSGYSNTCTTSGTEPVTCFGTSGPCTDGTVVWVKIGTNAPLQDGFCGSDHTCAPASPSCYVANDSAPIILNVNSLGPCTLSDLYNSEPVPYELPVRYWLFQILSSFIAHYNGNANVDYLRVGSPAGGEFSVSGDFPPIFPYGGSTYQQQRAQWISWVNKFDAQIMFYSPTFRVFSDINCVSATNDSDDCIYADQEALAAYNNGLQGIGNQDYDIEDMNNLGLTGNLVGGGCTFPLAAATEHGSACTQGDWAYNFATYPSLVHELQSHGNGTTPIDCAADNSVAGPLQALPVGSTYCATGTIGLTQSLLNLCSAGTGSPNVKICVNVLEMHTEVNTGSPPTVNANDTLLALSSTYSSTVGAVSAYIPYQPAYAAAFCEFLELTTCPTFTLRSPGAAETARSIPEAWSATR
jgi:hypothetical protein